MQMGRISLKNVNLQISIVMEFLYFKKIFKKTKKYKKNNFLVER